MIVDKYQTNDLIFYLPDNDLSLQTHYRYLMDKKVENELSKFMGDNKRISDELGARAIQGKAYLPGPDDKDEIIENED